MTAPDYDAIAARAEAATPGPWDALFGGPGFEPRSWWMSYDDPEREGSTFDWQQITADAEFVNNARTDVPALLARCRDLEAENEAWQSVVLMTTHETLAAACRTAAVSSAHADLLNAVAARMLAMRSWIDGAKVDLDGYDDARAAIDRVRALHVAEWVVIDYVGGYVCRECREPVESEPCATIRALDGGATDPQTQEGP